MEASFAEGIPDHPVGIEIHLPGVRVGKKGHTLTDLDGERLPAGFSHAQPCTSFRQFEVESFPGVSKCHSAAPAYPAKVKICNLP